MGSSYEKGLWEEVEIMEIGSLGREEQLVRKEKLVFTDGTFQSAAL